VVNKRALARGKEHVITRHMPPTSVQILVGLHGAGSVHTKGADAVNFHRGEAVVVPATTQELSVRPKEEMEYLHISLPHDAAEHPKTVLA
jgi:quercetin dioxygenase-like cupin family protein